MQRKPISLATFKRDVTSAIKEKDSNAKPKLTKVGLIDLLPENIAENIRDNEKYGDALGGMLGGDYDPNSYEKAVKRAAIRYFKKMRGK